MRIVVPRRRLLAVSLFAIAAGLLEAMTMAIAHVHHNDDGSSVTWYPHDCCHDGECHPVANVERRSDGLVMTTDDGTTLWISARRARRLSHDERWHVCFEGYEAHEVLCVFEPASAQHRIWRTVQHERERKW